MDVSPTIKLMTIALSFALLFHMMNNICYSDWSRQFVHYIFCHSTIIYFSFSGLGCRSSGLWRWGCQKLQKVRHSKPQKFFIQFCNFSKTSFIEQNNFSIFKTLKIHSWMTYFGYFEIMVFVLIRSKHK